jgi:maleylpyruvate isomerase
VHKVARFLAGYGENTMNDLQRTVRGATAAHAQLLGALHDLDDNTCVGPSLLPGWSVGHVLTHLARNADSHVVMLLAANRGEVAAQYPGGAAQRADDIEAGAARPAAAQLADLAVASARLEAAWAEMTDDGWQGVGEAFAGSVPVHDLPFRRWREVTLHHSDLGLGDDWSVWPAEYVRLELGRMTMQWASRKPMGLTTLPPAAMALPDAQRVAWLTGRLVVDGLDPAGILG